MDTSHVCNLGMFIGCILAAVITTLSAARMRKLKKKNRKGGRPGAGPLGE